MSPEIIIREETLRGRRADARLAGLILYSQPDMIGDKPIGDFLLQIKCIGRKRVAGWLERAGVNPWRPCSKLSGRERDLIVAQLVRFSKGQS